jgi:hypothetical protein
MVTFIVCSTNCDVVPIVALTTNFYTVPMSAGSVKKISKLRLLSLKLVALPSGLAPEYLVLVHVTEYWQSKT